MRWETVTGTLANVIAKIGGVTAAGLGIPTLLGKINDALSKVDIWIAGHPQAAKVIMGMVAAVAALLLIIGSLGAVLAAASTATSWALGGWVRFGAGLKVVAGIVRTVGVVMLTNPVVAIAAGIAVAALLIYKYWGPISGFFKRLWQGLKAGLKELQPFYAALAGIPTDIVSLGPKLFNAGANILKSLWQGMKSMMDKPISVMKEMAMKLREYLPFSPAKVGPLKDIHKIKLVETIAASIKPGPMVKAMGAVTAATAMAATPMLDQGSIGGGARGQAAAGDAGASHITYAPVINVSGAADAEGVRSQVDQALKISQAEFERMLARSGQNKQRKGFV